MKGFGGIKLRSIHLQILLGVLGLILIGMGLAGAFGLKLSEKLASDVSNGVIIAAVAIFLYNRKLRADEAKARTAAAPTVDGADRPDGDSK